MQSIIKKWGNSLGLRIPKNITGEVGLEENTTVEVRVSKGRIVIEPLKKEKSLEELLSQVNEQNVHNEIPHDSKGIEAW